MKLFSEDFRKYFGFWILIILFLIIIILFIYLLSPLFYVLCWAGILAVFIYPIYRFINKKLKGKKRLSAIIVLISFTAFIIAPLSFIIFNLYSQVLAVFKTLQPLAKQDLSKYIENLKNYPHVYGIISKIVTYLQPYLPQIQERFYEFISQLFQSGFQFLKNFIKSLFSWGFQLALTLITLYYFLIDGEKFLGEIKNLIPGEEHEKERIFQRIAMILKGVLYGNILTGLVQGFFAFLIYFILGIPQYLFWAFLTVIASFIPVFGTGLIWGPLTIYLLIKGSYIKALILLIYSVLIIAQVDNFLKPFLIGERIKIHNLFIFFSVIGGLAKFGILGLFLGPVILGLILSIIEIYKMKFLS